MAFHDDVYMATPLARMGPMHAVVQEELFVHACIRVHHGKTKVWNQAGVRPVACNALECIAQNCASCGVDGVYHPHSAAGDQGVGDAHWTRLRCRPVGVSEKGTRGFAQQNTVHQ